VKPAVYKIRNAANVLNWEPEASGLLCSVTSLAHLLSKCFWCILNKDIWGVEV
jgi:hypothetical protein